MRVTLLNRGRAKSEGFPLNRLSVVVGSLHGESSRLVKAGIFPRRESVSRFGRMSGWHWVETGVILLDSKIVFVKGDLTPLKTLMTSIDAGNRNDSEEDILIPPLGSEIIFDLVGSVAFYDSSITGSTSWYALRLVSQYSESEILSLPDETTLNEWINLINYLASTTTALSPPPADTSLSPAILRRRAGTMAPPAGRPIPLRAVSSTLELRGRSKSEQPPLSTPIQLDKLHLCSQFQHELETKLHLQKVAVESLERTARGLLLQCPVQEKTRVQVISALERVVKRLKMSRIELERGECYIDVLGQFVGIMRDRKVRLVEESASSTEDFHLPSLTALGDLGDSIMTEGVGRGSSLLDDIDVPIRRIGTPTLSASSCQQSKIDTHAHCDGERNVQSPVPQIITTNTTLTDSPSQLTTTPVQSPLQSRKTHNIKGIPTISASPSNINTSSQVEKTNTNTSIPVGSPLHMGEITRIVREVGF